MTSGPEFPHRTIRSFVRREGRITEGQQRALAELLPRYGVPAGDTLIDLAALFGRNAPVHVEIGFGNGDALAAMASAHPHNDYLGIEVHRPGVGALLRQLDAGGIANVRVISTDAVQVLEQHIADDALNAVCLFFPDPWPKKRHHKRRIVQPPFITLLASRLAPGAYFHTATDWKEYAEWMLEVLRAEPLLENTADGFAPRPAWRPQTKFETRGLRLGHGVWDLLFRKRPG